MASATVLRLPFCLAVALIAGALADPLVESVSNTGVFGGHYADDNHITIVPTLLVGVVLVLQISIVRCFATRRQSGLHRDWLVDVAMRISARPPMQDFACVFGLQIAALFVMESLEQIVGGGRLLGGTAWLGGPIAFSLLTHALVCVGCMFAVNGAMRAIVTTFAALIRVAIDFILVPLTRAASCILASRNADPTCLRAQTSHVRHNGERAPPPLPTLA